MEFEFLGRKITTQASHFLLFLMVFLSLGLGIALVSLVLATINHIPGAIDFTENFLWTYEDVNDWITPFLLPAIAYFLLKGAGIFKLKKDIKLCRACPAVFFILFLALHVFISIISLLFLSFDAVLALGKSIISILTTGFSAVLMYLWMLIFLALDKKKIKKAAELGILFALVIVLLVELQEFFELYSIGLIYVWKFSIYQIQDMMHSFMFGLVLLYHIPKKIGRECLLLAGLYISPFVLLLLLRQFMWFGEISFELDGLLYAVISLGVLYLFGKTMHLKK